MAYYMVYWPQDRVVELKRAGDEGPIKVVYGSIHSRMPSIASIKVGDVVFPVTLMKKKLYAMARLPVDHRECAFDYCMRELGGQHGALVPEGTVLECGGKGTNYYWGWAGGNYLRFDSLADVPEGLQIIPLSEQVEKPHLEHQNPFNCCSQWAAWGEGGSSILPRPLPDETIPMLRFGVKGREKALRLDKNGNILSMSLAATRRMSEETARIFEGLF